MKLRIAATSMILAALILAGAHFLPTANQPTADANNFADDKLKPIEDDMHEFMEYAFQPTYKRLKGSMAEEPKDNGGWKAIKADSLLLAEGGNLLLMRSEGDPDWDKSAIAVRRAGGKLYQAARKKDYSAAKTNYVAMLVNCNACHQQFADGKHQLAP
jgi:hypothetical protein